MLRCIPGVLFTFIVLGTWMFSQEISPKVLPAARDGQFVVTYDETVTPQQAQAALAVIKEVFAANSSTLGDKEFRVRLHNSQSAPLVRFEHVNFDQVVGDTEAAMATFGQMIAAHTFGDRRAVVQIANVSGGIREVAVADADMLDYVRRKSE